MSSSTATASGAQPPLSTADFTYAVPMALAFIANLVLASYLCFRLTRHNQTLNPAPSFSSANSSFDTGGVRIIFVAEDQDMQAAVGVDPRVINSYPKFPFSNKSLKSDPTCPICLCDYKEAEMLRMLPECEHCFHVYCVDAWLKLSASCPVCRNSPMPTPLSQLVPPSHYNANLRR